MKNFKSLFKMDLQTFAEDPITSLNILNEIRSVAGDDYASRIPQATRENIAEIGNTILAYAPTPSPSAQTWSLEMQSLLLTIGETRYLLPKTAACSAFSVTLAT